MTDYLNKIEQTYLVSEVEQVTTTGDVEYPGTALEVTDVNGKELFHFVVDSNGNKQVVFFATAEDYRMSLELLRELIDAAEVWVKYCDD